MQRTDHFSAVAQRYRDLRATDPEPVAAILARLPQRPLRGLDVGCGTGRYTQMLHRGLSGGSVTLAGDPNPEMLAVLKRHVSEKAGLVPVTIQAEKIPVRAGSVDWICSFNAVHHFRLDRFLRGLASCLKPGGLAFIYTRTPEQNSRNIWGRLFPKFLEKETRLHDRETLQQAIDGAPDLRFESALEFSYPRRSTRERLRQEAEQGRYSTFSLYGPEEFRDALETFLRRLPRTRIEWTEENLLMIGQRVC